MWNCETVKVSLCQTINLGGPKYIEFYFGMWLILVRFQERGGIWNYNTTMFDEQTCTMTYSCWKHKGYLNTFSPRDTRQHPDSKRETDRPGWHSPLTEAEVYYSEKQKGYGYKSKISVLVSAICIHFSSQAPERVADIALFRRNINWHGAAVAKFGDERHGENLGKLNNEHGEKC